MAVSRYEIVRRRARGLRVLEVACGSGQGLGFVRESAATVIGGDLMLHLLRRARANYGPTQPLAQFDAHHLPFRTGSVDLIEIHEAIYYLRDADQVFWECRRVLAPGGTLIISSINPEWADFNPSPHAVSYFTEKQLESALRRVFRDVQMLFGFPVKPQSSGIISLTKRTAVRLGLIPKTMAGKRLLKRLFFGPLVTVPSVITESLGVIEEPQTAQGASASQFKIIYAIAAT